MSDTQDQCVKKVFGGEYGDVCDVARDHHHEDGVPCGIACDHPKHSFVPPGDTQDPHPERKHKSAEATAWPEYDPLGDTQDQDAYKFGVFLCGKPEAVHTEECVHKFVPGDAQDQDAKLCRDVVELLERDEYYVRLACISEDICKPGKAHGLCRDCQAADAMLEAATEILKAREVISRIRELAERDGFPDNIDGAIVVEVGDILALLPADKPEEA